MANRSFLWDLAKKYFTAGLIGLTVSDRYVSVTAVRGSSMYPTLNPHRKYSDGFVIDDYVLVEKLCLEKYKFSRGDVVVFRSPGNFKEKHIKRITALSGDWVDLSFSSDAVRIPEGHCWVEGDNVSCSMDSRLIGPVCSKSLQLYTFAKLNWYWCNPFFNNIDRNKQNIFRNSGYMLQS
ncbi:uncharacterized protein [Primulina huaijiensis]|uniref:uncharacterized protein isoform X1 n=1 Tax=Primulina huaijiensis TaxID=1492673 RepID=UPI003CC77F41